MAPKSDSEKKGFRLAFILAAGVACLAMLAGVSLGGSSSPATSAVKQTAFCVPGSYFIDSYDNSFTWAGGGLISTDSVTWTGDVALYEDLDNNCQVTGIEVHITGPVNGGTLSITGNVFVSITVQYPSPFGDYANVATNAVGNLTSFSPPAGGYPSLLPTVTIAPRFDINAVGADEYLVQGLGAVGAVNGLQAVFELPLNLLGQTVHVQTHVGDNLCTCSVTDISIPGESPPSPPPPPAGTWSVYIHAHEDDWQLWETPMSYADYQAGDHLLFIYVTAGDAGSGTAYWQAREEAAKASVMQLAGSGFNSSVGWVSVCYTDSSQVCHSVWEWTYGSTVSIFMRLPDGGNMGGGFSYTGYESLSKLRDGTISNITTIDGSATYTGWQDVYRTLAATINVFAPYDATTTVHAPDFDRNRQTAQSQICPGCEDHADHLAVADAVYNATAGLGAPWTREFFIDYPLGFADTRYPVNVDSANYTIKKDIFMAYNDAMIRLVGQDAYSAMPWFYENAFQRMYDRTV